MSPRVLALLSTLLLGCPAQPPPGEDPPPPSADAGADRQAWVGEELTFDAPAGATWYFGDGAEAPIDGAPATHAYLEPGHFTAVLELIDDLGRSSTDAAVVHVAWPPSELPISAAAALAASPDGSVLWAVLDDAGLLVEVDVAERRVLRQIDVGPSPRSVAVGEDRVVVASETDRVLVFDGSLASIAHVELPTGCRPFAAVPIADGVAAACQGTGDLLRFGPPDWAPRAPLAVGPDLRGLARIGDRLLATTWRSPDDRGRWYSIDGDAVVETALALDPGPDSDTGARGVPSYLGRIAIRPDGRVAATAGTQANVQRGLARDGLPLTHETVVRATVRQVALADEEGPVGSELPRKAFDDRGLASAVAWSERGDWLYVAMHGMETVEVLDAYDRGLVGAFSSVGHGPQGIWASPDGEELWVFSALSRELAVYSLVDLGAPQVELARIDLLDGQPEPLPADVQRGKVVFHRSADPRMTRDGYVSCGSCHFDGLDDGRTWDFTDRGEGLRNTIDLRGRADGPIHWSGNFDELQDFENDIRGPQQGAGFLTDEQFEARAHPLGEPKAGLDPDLDALAAYMDWIADDVPTPPEGDPALIELGRALFEDPDVGCADCHPAPTYTDSAWLAPGQPRLHDVGTLTDLSGQRLGDTLIGLDTPTLRGVFATPPYLHDGSAPTLRDVVTTNSDDEHGVTSSLTAGQIDALVAFVASLD